MRASLAIFAVVTVSLAALAASGCKKRETSVATATDSSVYQAITPAVAAPVWKVTDVDGRALDSADLKGKVVVIDFWATWCPPCIAEVPGYVALQEKLSADGVVIIGLSLDTESAVVKKFMEEKNVNYRVAVVDETMVAAFGNFSGIPTTFVIDREGRLRFKKTGGGPIADLEQVVKTLL